MQSLPAPTRPPETFLLDGLKNPSTRSGAPQSQNLEEQGPAAGGAPGTPAPKAPEFLLETCFLPGLFQEGGPAQGDELLVRVAVALREGGDRKQAPNQPCW